MHFLGRESLCKKIGNTFGSSKRIGSRKTTYIYCLPFGKLSKKYSTRKGATHRHEPTALWRKSIVQNRQAIF